MKPCDREDASILEKKKVEQRKKCGRTNTHGEQSQKGKQERWKGGGNQGNKGVKTQLFIPKGVAGKVGEECGGTLIHVERTGKPGDQTGVRFLPALVKTRMKCKKESRR